MSRLSRVILVLVAALLLVLAVIAVVVVFLVREPFPQTDGTVTLEGLQDEVHVYRDSYGVPQIVANNMSDLYFAQGYVHAQDRFWQMEFWRRTGQGRLAEILGEDLVGTDKYIRTFGWNRMAQTHLAYYETEEPEVMAMLQAYSDGVNAYLADHRDDFSLNQRILGLVYEPWEVEPWKPLDTIAWGVVMSWDLGANWEGELLMADLRKEVGEAAATMLLPTYPYEARPVIAPTDALENRDSLPDTTGATRQPALVEWRRVDTAVTVADLPFGLGTGDEGLGSNNWVISGEHTATGAPLLANDPHLGIQMPSIWYEVGLHAPDFNVVGFSFAGVPGVIIGHNDDIAWGVTNVGPDVQDLYIEKINPNNPDEYEYEGEWQEMTLHEEVIKVSGGEDVVVTVRETRHGPIINDVVDGQSDVLSFRWTVQEPNRLMRAVMMLNRAGNYDEFREALRYFDAPSQNFIYADNQGNIAYQTPGRIPIRENSDGLMPVPGWTDTYEWDAYIPYEDLPALLNPEPGYIVTANNAVVDDAYPYAISHYWAAGDRAQRIVTMIEEAIAGNNTVDQADIKRMQMDSKSLLAEVYVDLLEGASSDDARVQAAIERLRGWDLQSRRDSVPAALFEVFYKELAHAVLADELGAFSDSFLANDGGARRVFFSELATQPDAVWWDNVNTSAQESQEEIMRQALEATVTWFEENVGGDMEKWTWGNLHTATFVSNPLGQSGNAVMEWLVNRGPFPVDGSNSEVLAASWSWDDVAAVRSIPSLRMIVDLSDLDASQAVHPTGQSGHPFHAHYDDMIELWQNGEYFPMGFSREAYLDAAVDHLVLQPPGAEQ